MNICRSRCANSSVAVLAVGLVLALGACSWVPEWADPVEWYKDTTSLFDSDEGKDAARKERQRANARSSPGADQPFPSLSTVPERPSMASPGERRKVEQSLVADRTEARHETIRPSSARASAEDAPPPPVIAEPPSPVRGGKAAPSEAPKPAEEPKRGEASRQVAAAPQPEEEPKQAESMAEPPKPVPPPTAPKEAAAPAPAPAPKQKEMRKSRPAPAAPEVSVTVPPFPSPEGNEAVRESYRAAIREQELQKQLSRTGGLMPDGDIPRAGRVSPRPTVPPSGALPVPRPRTPSIRLRPPPGVAAAPAPAPETAMAQAGQGIPQYGTASVHLGTILFANGSSSVSGKYSNTLKKIAEVAKSRRGVVRVVGHASRRTRDVDPLRHRIANFRISMQRARAVADRLVRLGVPASRMNVVAMSDNQPIYHEFMPAGEAGNRRAEIYLDY